MPDLADALAAAGVRDLVTDPDILEGYRFDQAAPELLPAGRPALVVRARDTAEVADTVRVAAARGVPVVPRGAGSGLSGGANAVDGGIVLSTERLTRLLDVDPAAMTARVQAGVLNADLKAAAGAEGLFYAPDPSSHEFCTIGGNVATNAGGLCCVRYGTTREAVLGLEVVTADGSTVELGRRTRKGVAGYDLVALMCGSEGTLGVVTEATVRLHPRPPRATTVAASFPRLQDAGRAIARIVRAHTPSLLEVMDATTIAAVEALAPMELDLDAGAMLFAASSTGADAIAQTMEEAGASIAVVSDDEAEGRMLLAARRLAYPALERQGRTLLDDVAVPVHRITDLIERTSDIARRYDLTIGTFGHAGEGNLHPTIVYAPDRAADARAAFTGIVDAALELGGTLTGEHGVGLLKADLLERELGDALRLHRAVKRALDPQNLLTRARRWREVPVDQLHPRPVRVADEAHAQVRPLARPERWRLRLDAVRGQPRHQPVEVVDRERHVAGARHPLRERRVGGQLEHRAVRPADVEQVDGAELHPAPQLEPEPPVEGQRRRRVRDLDVGVVDPHPLVRVSMS